MGNEMTSVERVLTALRGGEPDRVPTFEWLIDRHVIGDLCPGCNQFDFVEQSGLDGVVVYDDGRKQWLDGNRYVDEWGITMAMMTEEYPTSVDFPIKDPERLSDLVPPDPCAEWRFETLRAAVRRFKGQKAILFRLRDAYSLPRYLRGMENLMMDLVLNPDLVRDLVQISVDHYTCMAYRAAELGADVFWTSDDYCDNNGPIMGPRRWREFFLPGLRRLVQNLKDAGYPFIKHCDGYVNPILPDMVDAGIDCIDPIDADAGVDLAVVKAAYGDRVAIKGGVPVGSVLSEGTPEDAVASVKGCLRAAAPDGGYILSSSSDITASVRSENYAAMLEALREFGRYPLEMDRLRPAGGIV